jgi:hypothetical protein
MENREKTARLMGPAPLCSRAGLVGKRLTTGLTLIALLLAAGGVGLVAAVSGDASGLAPSGKAVAAPAASNGSNWLRIRRNLSDSRDVDSGFPDIAIDGSGQYVAVVWTEGYDSSAEAKHHGQVYLRWNSEGSGMWSNKIELEDKLFDGFDEDYWATNAAVTLEDTTPPTAHVVWVRFEKDYGWRVRYCACKLGGTCGSAANLSTLSGEDSPFFVPDIVAGGGGRLFVVWVHKYFLDPDWQRVIEFREFDGQAWLPIEEIGSGVFNDWPAVAIRGQEVYVAWLERISNVYRVPYKKKTVGGSSWPFSGAVYSISDSKMSNPFLAADDNTVYVAWEIFDSDTGILNKDDYSIRYKYDSGSGWEPSVGYEAITNTASTYLGTISDEIYEEPEYQQLLRPALALDDDGVLHAVWHHNYYVPPIDEGDPTTDTHRVLYTSSISLTASPPTWEPLEVFAKLSADGRPFSQRNVSPRIVVSGSALDLHVHVVLMKKTSAAWDVWYLSNQLYESVLMPMVMKNG